MKTQIICKDSSDKLLPGKGIPENLFECPPLKRGDQLVLWISAPDGIWEFKGHVLKVEIEMSWDTIGEGLVSVKQWLYIKVVECG